jgi:excisionase family DNA binding protein
MVYIPGVDEGDRRGVDRLTIQEAARRLGVSEGAVRKRVSRGTLEHHKDEDGRVYVYLDNGVDEGVDEGVDPNSNALISQLRDEVAYLRDENRRKDEIIMQQATTMRQLTAAPPQEPSEARESDVSPGPTGELGEVREELAAEQARRETAETTLHEGMAEEQRRREEAERERDDLRRELYALSEPRQSSETGEEQQGRGQPRSEATGAHEGVQRPWWRRVLGR